jgi:hypothetical protein
MSRMPKLHWTTERAEEFESGHRRIREVASLAHKCVRPLIRMTNGRPEQIGSGTLVSIRGVRFVFTAAHVLDWFDGKEIYVAGDGVLVPLAVTSERTNPPTGASREQDRIDAAVLRITNEIGDPPGIQFLDGSQLDVREWMNPAPHYLLYGYPLKKTVVDPTTKRIAGDRIQILVPTGTDEDAARVGVHRDLHVVFGIDPKRMVSETGVRAMPSPRGISGGGVWSIRGLDHPRTVVSASLVAIFIEIPLGSKTAVSTRICYHFELIRTAWPDIGAGLPNHGKAPIRLRRAAT